MDWTDFLDREVPEEIGERYHYLRQMERLVNALYSLDDSFDRFYAKVKRLKEEEAFEKPEDELHEAVEEAKQELIERIEERDLRDVDIDYEFKRSQESFRSQCRKLRDETLNKAFMEQLRGLDNKQIHQAKVVPKDEELKLKKALFSCGTHCVIQREQDRLDDVVEEKIIELLRDLQEDRRTPQEVFTDVREMFLLSARSKRHAQQ